jgi:beta-phosphoglucomutase-like phosphatase (HAD superfamily)
MDIAGQPYRVLVFDFDGVLADSVAVKTEAFGQLFSPYGKRVQDRVVSHHLAHGGMTRKEKFVHYFDQFLGRSLDGEKLEALCRQFSDLVVERVIAAPEIQGARAFLERACKAGIPCYVDSATPDGELERILAHRGIDGYFQKALGSDRSKRENLEAILKMSQTRPEDCLFFGDAASDCEAAEEVGTGFMGILPGPTAPLLKTHPGICWAENFIDLEKGKIHGRE